MQYDHGLSKIYELVVNSDPCYAFLLDGNSLIQNKLIVAHVLAHSDFFKNNARFSTTNRDMVESMSSSASRIRQYEIMYGTEAVESFIDAAMAIQEHINPSIVHPYGLDRNRAEQQLKKDAENSGQRREGEYDDLWSVSEHQEETLDNSSSSRRNSPPGQRRIFSGLSGNTRVSSSHGSRMCSVSSAMRCTTSGRSLRRRS